MFKSSFQWHLVRTIFSHTKSLLKIQSGVTKHKSYIIDNSELGDDLCFEQDELEPYEMNWNNNTLQVSCFIFTARKSANYKANSSLLILAEQHKYECVVAWVIVRVCSVVLRKTAAGVDWHFDNLSGSHHQSKHYVSKTNRNFWGGKINKNKILVANEVFLKNKLFCFFLTIQYHSKTTCSDAWWSSQKIICYSVIFCFIKRAQSVL